MPPCVQASDQLEDLRDQLRREAERGLVQHQEPRVRHQRPGDRELLLLAAGQRAGRLAPPLRKDREQLAHRLEVAPVLVAVAADEGAKAQVLLDGQRRKDLAVLGDHRDAPAHDRLGCQPGDRLAAEGDRALARRQHAHDSQKRRRLAGAIGADQGNQLAVLDLDRDAPERGDRTIVRVHVPKGQHPGPPAGRRDRPRPPRARPGPPPACPRRWSGRSSARAAGGRAA